MRKISVESISEEIARLCIRANTILPPELCALLERAAAEESEGAAAGALDDIVENFRYAARSAMPICQDTGMAVVFAEVGQQVQICGGLFEDAVNEGVRRGYERGLLRKSVVADPVRRGNTDDNCPAVIYTRLTGGDKIRLTVAPKGFGSENMSAIRMFLPGDGAEKIEEFVVQTVKNAGARPCPPIVVGVGLGGTFEQAALISKLALIRPVDRRSGDEFYARMEERLLEKINALNIGAQGFGGKHTALAVNIETRPTHIAGLPCAVNIGCHVTRHAEGEI
ncbi:MAG: fumarate hydratase [Oscillospiraceae bacterium]|nr:fumarate hydratase [Oscillospiraceae bacterium]